MTSIPDEIERFLRTGDHDPVCTAWPGNVIERSNRADDELRRALVAEVKRLAGSRPPRRPLADRDLVAFTRRKVEPMVRGLFARAEQEAVLATLEQATIVLTPENIEGLLLAVSYLSSAWNLANLYLTGVGANVLAENAPRLVGLSEHTTFYVSAEYFENNEPFDDFIVHEAAHVFHNCKRRTLGLRATRRHEWLLEIDFRKRETFAYACEIYSRIVARAPRLADRAALGEHYERDEHGPPDERVDRDELVAILREAASARNGWKKILARCAPER